MKKSIRVTAIIAFVLIVMTSCSGSGGSDAGTPVNTYAPVDSITLTSGIGVIAGESVQLTAAISPNNATDQSVKWQSSEKSVAAVSDSGYVTGIKAGTAIITVTTNDGAHAADCTVTVSNAPIPAKGISLNKKTASIYRWFSETLIATINPLDATNQGKTWKSLQPDIADVNTDGVVSAKNEGTAEITVTTDDGSFSDSCTVTVMPVTPGVTLNSTAATLITGYGYTYQFTAKVSPPISTITWGSSDETILTVDSKGLVIPKAAGTAKIRAEITVNNITYFAECSCTVKSAASSPFTTTSSGSNITLSKYTGTDTAVVIPSSINGSPVTIIASQCFYNCTAITSVIIPPTVTSIQMDSFEGCTGLASITVPASVTFIDSEAFRSCTKLTAIKVNPENQWYKDIDGVVFNKDGTILICCPRGKSGSYTIPSGVTTIASGAFDLCINLTGVSFPSGMVTISQYAFMGCSGLKSAVIPDSVTTIGNYSFYFCTSLNSLTLPAGIARIGEYAFGGCALTRVDIPSSVTVIAKSAFTVCKSMTAVTIPSSVTEIGVEAFKDCTALQNVTIPSNVSIIGQFAFSGCTSLASATFAPGAKFTGIGMFQQCSSLSNVTLPSGMTTIGYSAFSFCTSLKTVAIPSSVTTIGGSAFGSSGLTGITIPSGVTKLEYGVFAGCKLTTLEIPNGVTAIDDWVFSACSTLSSVTIPSSVTSIGSNVFPNCTLLTSVTLKGSVPPTLGTNTFTNPNAALSIKVPAASVSAYKNAVNWASYAAKITGY